MSSENNWVKLSDVAADMGVNKDKIRGMYKKYIKDTDYQNDVMRKVEGTGRYGVIEVNNKGISVLKVATVLERRGKHPQTVGELFDVSYHKTGNFTQLEALVQKKEDIRKEHIVKEMKTQTVPSKMKRTIYPNDFTKLGVILSENMEMLIDREKKEIAVIEDLTHAVQELNCRLSEIQDVEKEKPTNRFLSKLKSFFK